MSRFFPARLALLASLLVVLMLGSVATASAAPLETTLTLAELAQQIEDDPDNRVPAYFLTVVRGAKVQTVTCDVLGVTSDTPDSAYILFDSQDPIIKYAGGIAAGMSGSPLFIGDGSSTGALVGAVSYGEALAMNGAGLATPIDAMAAIEGYQTQISGLREPVLAGASVVDRVIITTEPERFEALANDGALIVEPLSSVFIGGLRPGSNAYQVLSAELARSGISVVPVARMLGATATNAGLEEVPLTGGSAVAALSARGDIWSGQLGTATYVNDQTLLAFGHSAYWTGPTSLYLMDAWVDGVWPSQLLPYKMGRPANLRGAFTQDRMAGVLGQLDTMPEEVVVSSAATFEGETEQSTSYITDFMMNSEFARPSLAAAAASVPGYRFFDSEYAPGSALTTTTVVLDDAGTERTIKLTNRHDSDEDVAYSLTGDLLNALYQLHAATAETTETLDIQSIAVTSEISSQRSAAQIVGVELLSGLKVGSNPVRVSFLPYRDATRTIDTSITIPAGTPLTGTLRALPALDNGDDYLGIPGVSVQGDEEDEEYANEARRTIAQVEKDLEAEARNDDFALVFEPSVDGEPVPVTTPISSRTASPWVVDGRASQSVAQILLDTEPRVAPFNDYVYAYGEVVGPTSGVIHLMGRSYGGAETTLAVVPIVTDEDGTHFEALLEGLKTNTVLRAYYAGNQTFSTAETSKTQLVSALARVRSSAARIRRGSYVTLTGTVWPGGNAGGRVVFERQDPRTRRWVALGTRTLSTSGSAAVASLRFRPPVGTVKVRIRFTGTAMNAATASPAATIYVR